MHVLTRKEELDAVRVAGKVVVVIDILFATTTMVAALAHGAREIVPATDEADARALAAALPPQEVVLSGELYAQTLPGFAHPAPLALLAHGVRGKSVVYSTTNGTVALRRAECAACVYGAALLNARRVAEHVVARHPGRTVLVLCSGSVNHLNLEDFYGAGYFVDCLVGLLGPSADLSDAARAAHALYRQARLPEVLLESRVGRMMAARGLTHEVQFAARLDAFPVVPVLGQGRLRLVA